MKIKLLDFMGYLIHVAEVSDAPRVQIWGARVFLKVSKRTYQQVRHGVIRDTAPDFKVPGPLEEDAP